MANVFDVAKYVLENTGEISTYKLQKLCYYSQAWNLVWHDIPLYDSPIMAFAHGPVIKELYDYHKGQFSIKSSDIKKCKLSNILTDSEKDTINRVLQFYGNKTAQWLSDLTHMEEPWRNARKGIPDGQPSSKVISLNDMMEYYSSLQ